MTSITISAFGDEIASDFEEQLQVLQSLKIPHLDLRAAWGVRVDNLSDEQVDQAVELLKKYDITVACIGSPIGKYPIQDSMESEIAKLQRCGEVAKKVGTKNIRFFSYYPQGDVSDEEIAESIARLKLLVEEAEKLDLVLQLENEKHLVGDIPARMLKLFEGVGQNPRLRFIWDPANFVQCGVMNQVDDWWEKLSPYIGYIHIKDAKADGTVYPAGEGDGQVEELLRNLNESGYDGVLSLEPHLQNAGHSSGFSGPDLMKVAVDALRAVMAKVGMTEQ